MPPDRGIDIWEVIPSHYWPSDAMTSLGVLYEKGLGGTQDLAKAREWYQKAVAAGNEDAGKRLKELSSK